MRRSNIRIMKMNSNNRSILMRALYADFCANREAGLPNNHLADFIRKLHEIPPGKLPLDAINALPPAATPMPPTMHSSSSSKPNRRCGRLVKLQI